MFRRPGLRLLSVLALLTLIAPAGTAATASVSAPASSGPLKSAASRAHEILLPLRVHGQRIRDASGRDVVLRGINVGSKDAPYLRDLRTVDFDRMRGMGFNHVRLYTSWEAVMPREGKVDRGYLQRLRTQIREFARHGLLVVVDMHQDLYGGPIGGGAPDWAYDSLGCPHVPFSKPTGAWGADYLSPATLCAFTHFWTSPRLQKQYAATWAAVAEAVGREPNVIGYDLMNEPFPGLIPPGVFDR